MAIEIYVREADDSIKTYGARDYNSTPSNLPVGSTAMQIGTTILYVWTAEHSWERPQRPKSNLNKFSTPPGLIEWTRHPVYNVTDGVYYYDYSER